MPHRSFLLVLLLLAALHPAAQSSHYHFRQVAAMQGLSDGVVRAVGQDKYGYIWIGTLSGLNRYNGYSVVSFFNDPKDSLSLPPHTVRSIHSDRKGRLWIGCARTLVEYRHADNRFYPVAGTAELGILEMAEGPNGTVFMATNQGMAVFEPDRRRIRLLKETRDTAAAARFGAPVTDFHYKGDRLYFTNRLGLHMLNPATGALRSIPLPVFPFAPERVVEAGGQVWLSYGSDGLYRTDTAFRAGKLYDEFRYGHNGTRGGSLGEFLVDQQGGFWITSSHQGLIQYDARADRFIRHLYNPLLTGTLLTTQVGTLFQGRNGFIYLGTEGNGLFYFHPSRNFFQILLPEPKTIEQVISVWSRSLVADSAGNFWIGLGGGLIQKTVSGNDRLYVNNLRDTGRLHDNSIRSLAINYKGDLYIGTASGVNRIRAGQVRPEFLDKKDSLPPSFYWAIREDSRRILWFGSRGNLYYWLPGEATAHPVASHPHLHPYKGLGVRSIYEDRHRRLWFGMNGGGLLFYDPATGRTKHWKRAEHSDTSLLNNTVTALTEDARGIIWISSFTGLTSLNPSTGRFTQYGHRSILPNLKTSGILADRQNRLWIASTGGLLLLDSSRRYVKVFDLQDGLPTMEFTDMPATRLPDGRFAFPTLRGYVLFDPETYRGEVKNIPVYMGGIRIMGKPYTGGNPEDVRALDLKWDQNFLQFELTALNYHNPGQTWYAYKLEGFDQDWVYTKDRSVSYTNIPGDRYTFRFKASADPNNWPAASQVVTLSIGTVFYKAWWFWGLVALLAGGLLYALYRKRIEQREKIFLLQNKAQALEKEKANVMYESLKQQLNPHFLFNSLTSLGSLIRVDQKLAGEFLTGMSRIYRYILKSRDHEIVPLGEELAFAGHYIRLQKTRFEYGFVVNIDVPEEYHHSKIAPVTLQNLIENAIKHNIIDDENPLVVDIYVENAFLVVRNNLQRKNFVDTSNKQGLANLKSLYRYLSARPLLIGEHNGYYIVKIPLI
ncbi:MAG TPA: two-component regulator propeller domain-containing protein [Chitinophagaceae bacterium]|jgi:ligand-binding sensor domain-containing protein|nr:two-component regulator propeller domain-containing protein [Chitinophagaceae bacterium]